MAITATASPTDTRKATVIDSITLFEHISGSERETLMQLMQEKDFPRYTYIYRQGESPEYIYFLAGGQVKIGVTHEDGREMINRILHPEAVFGESGIFSNDPYHNFAYTLNNTVQTFRIPVSEFRNFVFNSPRLSRNVLSMIGNRLSNTERRLESLVFKDARSRIIEFLRSNAEKHGRQVGYETFFKHNLTQQDIANFTGTSRQTVTSVLNDLRKANLIYFNRTGILIRDLSKLL